MNLSGRYSSSFSLIGEWMVSVSRSEAGQKSTTESSEELDKDKDTTEEDSSKPASSEPKGDPEMAPVYLKRLLPVFTQVYQRTMVSSIRCVILHISWFHMLPVMCISLWMFY